MPEDTRLEIFVFGSNLAGRHGAGAAADAVQNYGAIYGRGIGLQGRSYGIPTKDASLHTLEINRIKPYINSFIDFAERSVGFKFKITQIGCGLAGIKSKDIAPLFKEAPSNCYFDAAWKKYLGKDTKYWGTFDEQLTTSIGGK
jgi:hypothetical protein